MIRKMLLVISLLLLVTTDVVRERSYLLQDELTVLMGRREFWARTAYDTCVLGLWRNRQIAPLTTTHISREGPAYFWTTAPASEFLGFVWYDHCQGILIEFPLWAPEPLFAFLCAWLGWSWLRQRARRRDNLCTNCGYNLTGNVSGRCSECGTMIHGTSETV